MKQKFSTAWIGSRQPRKQRKFRENAPLHIKREMLAANLSKELRKKLGRRSIIVRKGDMVKIMRGEFRGKTGKVSVVETKDTRVAIEGIQRQKKEGSKVNVYFNPSNLQITEANTEDKKRIKIEEKKEEAKTEGKKKEDKKEKQGEKNAPNKK
ncbi:50S ribosomal protein L24 [Candidatus Pacearchaeota archaeon]|nr:50S ribosomal protein L24 [Candidatus Pacearchaeota archaeon]